MFLFKKRMSTEESTIGGAKKIKISSSDAESLSCSDTGSCEQQTSENAQDLASSEGEDLLEAASGETLDPSSVIAKLEDEVKENYDKYLRTLADIENIKKRSIRERSEILKYAGENVIRDILDVVDDFERAIKATPETPSSDLAEFLKGVKMIHEGLISRLERHEVKAKSALGEKFNPLSHEALASVPNSEVESGTVLEEFRKAYFFKDKLIRPGQVVVTVEPQEK